MKIGLCSKVGMWSAWGSIFSGWCGSEWVTPLALLNPMGTGTNLGWMMAAFRVNHRYSLSLSSISRAFWPLGTGASLPWVMRMKGCGKVGRTFLAKASACIPITKRISQRLLSQITLCFYLRRLLRVPKCFAGGLTCTPDSDCFYVQCTRTAPEATYLCLTQKMLKVTL